MRKGSKRGQKHSGAAFIVHHHSAAVPEYASKMPRNERSLSKGAC